MTIETIEEAAILREALTEFIGNAYNTLADFKAGDQAAHEISQEMDRKIDTANILLKKINGDLL